MTTRRDFLALYRAILWRLWIEQRRSILLFPLVMAILFGSVLAATRFAPGLLTGVTRHALQATSAAMPGGDGAAALPHAFIEHQAVYLLALLAGLSAASVATRAIGAEADRGSLEILLATRHDISAIGGAILLAAYTLASVGWVVLVGLSSGLVALFDAWLHLQSATSAANIGAAIAMQLVLTLLAAEVAMIVTLLFPGLARARTGVTADPATLLATLPALATFVVANLMPGISVLHLSLAALMFGAVLLVAGAASLHLWFRPERFLET
jgi:hypothetical protein